MEIVKSVFKIKIILNTTKIENETKKTIKLYIIGLIINIVLGIDICLISFMLLMIPCDPLKAPLENKLQNINPDK